MATASIGDRIERIFEEGIFRSRWLLAPSYLALVLALVVLSAKAIEEVAQLFLNFTVFDEARTILQALTIVDVVLVLNLVLMVTFVGYINFVSKIDPKKSEDKQSWMSSIDYSGLKIQLMGSIIAISSITLLREFIELSEAAKVDEHRLFLMIAVYATFLMASLIVALVNWLKHSADRTSRHGEDSAKLMPSNDQAPKITRLEA